MIKTPPHPTALAHRKRWADGFDMFAHEPWSWRLKAETLKESATIIRSEWVKVMEKPTQGPSCKAPDFRLVDLGSVWMMLAGLSLENLLKGLYISKKQTIAKNGRLIGPKKWKRHELLDLIDLVNSKRMPTEKIEITKEESNLLERATLFVQHFGKYPIATNYDATLPRPIYGQKDGFAPMSHVFLSDLNLMDRIYKKIEDLYSMDEPVS